MDVRLVRGTACAKTIRVLRGVRGGQLRSRHAVDSDSAQGVEGWVALVRPELLSPLSARGALPPAHRYVDVACRISLHHPANREWREVGRSLTRAGCAASGYGTSKTSRQYCWASPRWRPRGAATRPRSGVVFRMRSTIKRQTRVHWRRTRLTTPHAIV